MGMAASQARFLGLTARKTNVEYEGQQINQQRTSLANQSASYYSQLLGMTVPTPPAIADFTKTVYSFQDGNLSNTITSLIAQPNGLYKASYLSSYKEDFSIVSAGKTSIVNSFGTPSVYHVGADKLRQLEEDLYWAYVVREGSVTHRLYQEGANYKYTNINNEEITLVPATYERITSIPEVGKEPQKNDYILGPLIENHEQTVCYDLVLSNKGVNRSQHIEHNMCRLVWAPGVESITSSSGVTVTRVGDGLNYYSLAKNSGKTEGNEPSTKLKNALQEYYPDKYQQIIDLYVDNLLYLNKNGSDSLIERSAFELSTSEFDENEITIDKLYNRWETMWDDLGNMEYNEIYERDHAEWQAKYDPYVGKYFNSVDYTDVYTLTERMMFYDGENEYLKSLTSKQLEDLYYEEVDYRDRLNREYGEKENGWYIRYVENSATGHFEPIFYNGDDLANGVKVDNGDIHSHVSTYEIGTKDINREIKGVNAKLEKDATGRYIKITFNPGESNEVTHALTTNTVTDQKAYDAAMNQYEYDKHQYELSIQEINAKIEIVQIQDKNLELRLKQLDTEQDAIANEMEAIQKVIEKNTQSTFKTFG